MLLQEKRLRRGLSPSKKVDVDTLPINKPTNKLHSMIASVIGLGYGDEGKGLMVDYLARKCHSGTVVIRFSGGQQAGHTVVTDSDSHVFSNYGAGSLAGASSFFSEHCTFYPPNILREREALDRIKGANTSLTIHPLCNLTTHFDIAYNRYIESTRQTIGSHHGSCGLGINATIERNSSPFKLYAVDLMYPALFHQKLTRIWDYYNDKFSPEVWPSTDGFNKFTQIAKDLEADFILGCKQVISKHVIKIRDYEHIKDYPNIIFEGSQGILLDQDHGLFPHVTRANTTSKNITDILEKLGINMSETSLNNTYYMTRCYQTRHGKGWMSSEYDGLKIIGEDGKNLDIESGYEDKTNVFNTWQEHMRFGPFDYEAIVYACCVDKAYRKDVGGSTIVFTHMDQRPDFKIDIGKLPWGFDSNYDIKVSYGPKASDVRQVKLKEFTKTA